jgi:hypothetical protein
VKRIWILREDIAVLEFEPNTLAFMTASLELCGKRLKKDTPEARKFIADRLKECARRGRVTRVALTRAGEEAVAKLNSGTPDKKISSWRALLRSAIHFPVKRL